MDKQNSKLPNKLLITEIGLEYQNQLQPTKIYTEEKSVNFIRKMFGDQQKSLNLSQSEAVLLKMRKSNQIIDHLKLQIGVSSNSLFLDSLLKKASKKILNARGQSQKSLQLPKLDFRQRQILKYKQSIQQNNEQINQTLSVKEQVTLTEGHDNQDAMIAEKLYQVEKINRFIDKAKKKKRNSSLPTIQSQPDQLNFLTFDVQQLNKDYAKEMKIFNTKSEMNKRYQQIIHEIHQKKYVNEKWKNLYTPKNNQNIEQNRQK